MGGLVVRISRYQVPGAGDRSFTFVDASCTYKLNKAKNRY